MVNNAEKEARDGASVSEPFVHTDGSRDRLYESGRLIMSRLFIGLTPEYSPSLIGCRLTLRPRRLTVYLSKRPRRKASRRVFCLFFLAST